MIRVENLTVAYGAFKALTEISVDLGRRGQVHSIIGPNGAGKSTFMDAIVGKRRPSAGRIFYKDRDISGDSIQRRRKDGMARSFQKTSIFPGLTIFEQLDLVAAHLNEPDLGAIIDTMDLREVLHLEAARAAYGVQRRVDVALGLIGCPTSCCWTSPAPGCRPRKPPICFGTCASWRPNATSPPWWWSTMSRRCSRCPTW